MTIDTLDELFVHKLCQQYYAERKLVDALDEMAINATNDRISEGFADHRDETRRHVDRLETVFDEIGRRPEERTNELIDALEAERTEIERQVGNDDLLNTYYLGAGMMTERMEMTAYESLETMATQLEMGSEITDPLEANHDEEKSAYRELDAMSTASDLKSLWNRLTS